MRAVSKAQVAPRKRKLAAADSSPAPDPKTKVRPSSAPPWKQVALPQSATQVAGSPRSEVRPRPSKAGVPQPKSASQPSCATGPGLPRPGVSKVPRPPGHPPPARLQHDQCPARSSQQEPMDDESDNESGDKDFDDEGGNQEQWAENACDDVDASPAGSEEIFDDHDAIQPEIDESFDGDLAQDEAVNIEGESGYISEEAGVNEIPSVASLWARRRRAAAESAEPSSFKRVFLEAPADLSEDELVEINELREELSVELEGRAGESYAPLQRFEDLDVLPRYLLDTLCDLQMESPLPIQAMALPLILGGHDLIGIAQTGSGKTLAFLIPAIVQVEAQAQLDPGQVTPIVAILAPTRELVVQIAEEAQKLLVNSKRGNHDTGLTAACAYGGVDKRMQWKGFRQGCHIVAATPGRLCDYLTSGWMSLERTTYFVLDEADRMLDLGFGDDVQNIARQIRRDRQMLFFSATWPTEVQSVAKSLCRSGHEVVKLTVGQREEGQATVRSDITQEVVVFDQQSWGERDRSKRNLLLDHLRDVLQDESTKVLVFVNQKIFAEELANSLADDGFASEHMHGGRGQEARLNVLARFRRSETRLLVATDVMGRGLDIPDVSHVCIYDMCEIEDYVHRIGRTARGPNGTAGHALTFFEYVPQWSKGAELLVQVLEESGQEVPPDLVRVADEVAAGKREVSQFGGKKRKARGADSPWSHDSNAPAPADWENKSPKQQQQQQQPQQQQQQCWFFSQGMCDKGEVCPWSHDPDAPAPSPKKSECWYFFNASCTKGTDCTFSHERATGMPQGGGGAASKQALPAELLKSLQRPAALVTPTGVSGATASSTPAQLKPPSKLATSLPTLQMKPPSKLQTNTPGLRTTPSVTSLLKQSAARSEQGIAARPSRAGTPTPKHGATTAGPGSGGGLAGMQASTGRPIFKPSGATSTTAPKPTSKSAKSSLPAR